METSSGSGRRAGAAELCGLLWNGRRLGNGDGCGVHCCGVLICRDRGDGEWDVAVGLGPRRNHCEKTVVRRIEGEEEMGVGGSELVGRVVDQGLGYGKSRDIGLSLSHCLIVSSIVRSCSC